jgi:hypothetical protein
MNGNCIDIIDEEIIKIYRLIRTGSQWCLGWTNRRAGRFNPGVAKRQVNCHTGFIPALPLHFPWPASEYLATKSEQGDKHPIRASVYTGIAYVCDRCCSDFSLLSGRHYVSFHWPGLSLMHW